MLLGLLGVLIPIGSRENIYSIVTVTKLEIYYTYSNLSHLEAHFFYPCNKAQYAAHN